jgi:hypothetical protein
MSIKSLSIGGEPQPNAVHLIMSDLCPKRKTRLRSASGFHRVPDARNGAKRHPVFSHFNGLSGSMLLRMAGTDIAGRPAINVELSYESP